MGRVPGAGAARHQLRPEEKPENLKIFEAFHLIRKLVTALVLMGVLAGSYALWPLITAYQIRHAAKTGDVATLERKVHWAPVRASLKSSLAELSQAQAEARSSDGSPAPSMWTRVKAAAAPMLVDRFVDSYVNPEGINQLRQMGRSWRSVIVAMSGGSAKALEGATQAEGTAGASPDEALPALTRFINFYNRIVRARFHSLSAVEFEIADKHNAERRYISQFELSGLEWKLASVRVVGAGF